MRIAQIRLTKETKKQILLVFNQVLKDPDHIRKIHQADCLYYYGNLVADIFNGKKG